MPDVARPAKIEDGDAWRGASSVSGEAEWDILIPPGKLGKLNGESECPIQLPLHSASPIQLPGERLRSGDGSTVPVEGRSPLRPGLIELYNVEVEEFHTYFVGGGGRGGILVHNGLGDGCGIPKTAEVSDARKPVAGIVGFAQHAIDRVIGRGVSPSSILDALKRPLKTYPIKIDDLGRPSQRIVGRSAEVVVNPESRTILSVNPTSTQTRMRLLRPLGLGG